MLGTGRTYFATHKMKAVILSYFFFFILWRYNYYSKMKNAFFEIFKYKSTFAKTFVSNSFRLVINIQVAY